MNAPARAEILSIGSEMTDGPRNDTNSTWLRGQLAPLAVSVARVTVVSDDLDDLTAAFGESIGRAGVLLVTGGLGPTEDDRTLDALSRGTGDALQEDPVLVEDLRKKARRLGRDLSASARRMARRPQQARALLNLVGWAPGLVTEKKGTLIVVLPGVPAEMRGLFLSGVLADLRQRYGLATDEPLVMRVAGRSESDVDAAAATLFGRQEWTILTASGCVELHVRLPSSAAGEMAERARQVFGDDLVSCDGSSLEGVVVREARRRGGEIAVAESCTGGRVVARLTAVPGASSVLDRGFITYSDRSKTESLQVPPEILASHGAVSRETAEAMASGLATVTGCRWGVAVTGIAGPDGGTPARPVGTVWFATVRNGALRSLRRLISGDRERIQETAATVALDLLRRRVLEPGT